MASLLKAVFGDPKAKRAQVMEEIAVNRDMTLKTLFSQQFSLLNLDLLETLGTGTFGRVRLVKSLEDDRYYALKVMKKARIAKLKQLEHVQNEVRIMSHVRLPLMVELYAVFQDDNSLYMLLEYIPGGELFSHLRRQEKFAFAVYQFYAAEIVAAIQILHELNVMYRDIKPENILIHKDGHIRLSDFGFAKILDTSDRTFTLCGTPEYLAPEIIQGVGHGTSVDWWALGVLIFEMAAGYPPFYGDNPFSVYQKILQARIKFPSSVPQTARSIIGGFCTVNRTRRLGSGRGGFDNMKKHRFFWGIDWRAAARQLIVPPIVPTVSSAGDTSNFDFYSDEPPEELANLTSDERRMFNEIDESILERKAT